MCVISTCNCLYIVHVIFIELIFQFISDSEDGDGIYIIYWISGYLCMLISSEPWCFIEINFWDKQGILP